MRNKRKGTRFVGGPNISSRVYTPSDSAPLPPTELTLDASGSTFDLEWVDNSDNEEGFRLEWSLDENTWVLHSIAPANTTTASITPTAVTGPPANTEIHWRVLAFTEDETSEPTNTVSGTVTDGERIDSDRLVFSALTDVARIQAADIDRLVFGIVTDATRIQAADIDRLLLTVIVDQTYP
jgi:hypothetical protein